MPERRHHRHRPRQVLRRRRRPRRHRPRGARGHGPRPARAQRRRQDDRRPHPRHAAPARHGQRPRRRLRRRLPDAGIITQSISFGGFVTAIGLNEDLRKGLIDRFRSLPMARSAVLAGRTLADVALNTFSLAVMTGVGFVVGFNFDSPAGFLAIYPLTFASSAFVPTDSMPSWLEAFAEINPFTVVVNAVRALWLDAPSHNYVWGAFAWALAMIVVFAPLAVRAYRRAAVRA